MNKKDLIKQLIDKALKNYIKPGVMDCLIDLYNDSCQNYKAFEDMFYKNDDDTVDYLLKGLTPSEIIRYVSKDFKRYDAFIAFDGYGHLYSFHFNYVVDLLTDNNDFIDYVVDYVDIATLDKLSKLADQDVNKILQNAYNLGAE
jgi:hypothetical protein